MALEQPRDPRRVALLLAPILAGATWAHWGNGWVFSFEGGGWEYPLYLALLAVAQFLLGDGRLALSPSRMPRPTGRGRTVAGVA